MGKLRVYQLAKELGIETKELISTLSDLGISVSSHASSIDEESAKLVRDLFLSTPAPSEVEEGKKVVELTSKTITVRDLAEELGVKVSDLIKELMMLGILVTINQRIDISIIKQLSEKFNFEIKYRAEGEGEGARLKPSETLGKGELPRPPVVVIMGHVDHGKTKLLDAIRKSNIMDTEAGGITQHIGAYQVKVHGRFVTFLDTPGHEAFTALRARGAQVTDIAVLVVAADDGVMPQTIEAIHHARAAGVPIIVAINKIDKPEANVDRVKQQLVEQGLVPEDWGGDTVTVQISAKKEIGLDNLLEMILLVADMQELKALPLGRATGVIIESKLDKKYGPLATVLIKSGTLQVRDSFVTDDIYGKVRAMKNDKGQNLKSALPSMPVEVFGISEVPKAGSILQVVEAGRKAKEIATERKEEREALKGRERKFISLENFSKQVQEGVTKNLNLIIKADVQGSLEAILKSLEGLVQKDIKINIIHAATGIISESDIMLAKASDAIVIGFNISISESVKSIAEGEEVQVKIYNIIYQVVDEIKSALEGLLSPEYEEVSVGRAEVRTTFKSSKVGIIAGCTVLEGKLIRGGSIRVKKKDQVVYEGKLDSLKRFKEDVREVLAGFECGVVLTDYPNFAEGDIIEAFEVKTRPRKLNLNDKT